MNLLAPEIRCEVTVLFDAAMKPQAHISHGDFDREEFAAVVTGLMSVAIDLARTYKLPLAVRNTEGSEVKLA